MLKLISATLAIVSGVNSRDRRSLIYHKRLLINERSKGVPRNLAEAGEFYLTFAVNYPQSGNRWDSCALLLHRRAFLRDIITAFIPDFFLFKKKEEKSVSPRSPIISWLHLGNIGNTEANREFKSSYLRHNVSIFITLLTISACYSRHLSARSKSRRRRYFGETKRFLPPTRGTFQIRRALGELSPQFLP